MAHDCSAHLIWTRAGKKGDSVTFNSLCLGFADLCVNVEWIVRSWYSCNASEHCADPKPWNCEDLCTKTSCGCVVLHVSYCVNTSFQPPFTLFCRTKCACEAWRCCPHVQYGSKCHYCMITWDAVQYMYVCGRMQYKCNSALLGSSLWRARFSASSQVHTPAQSGLQ